MGAEVSPPQPTGTPQRAKSANARDTIIRTSAASAKRARTAAAGRSSWSRAVASQMRASSQTDW
ncbi:hypothetical protein LMG19282_04626 [Cupriavidus campinensis]|nr:hypothetical protein LMG19282_04626 [Cupriavidus campinensis]